MENLDAIVIGAGACGLMCAVQAGFLGKKVLVLEKNEKVGAKILISGGGRCNYTNLYLSELNFLSENQPFARSAFAQFTVEDTIQFFEQYGIIGEEKTLGQLFPVTNKASDVVRVFTDLCASMNQIIFTGANATGITRVEGESFQVHYEHHGQARSINAPKVVLCSGGLPVVKMGASDFSLQVARQFNLRVTETAPALVPLAITGKDLDWYAALSGHSVFCRVSNAYIRFEENVLFTHWGLSGPAILQISSYWRPGEKITIDLLPHESITDKIQSEKQLNGKRLLLHVLAALYSRKFAEALGKYLPIEKNLASLTRQDCENIDSFIHHFSFLAAGDKGYDKAEVMRGGVATEELSSKTMESKKVSGLYFGGECVDITGWLGGYNFQWAWSSGYVIAQHI